MSNERRITCDECGATDHNGNWHRRYIAPPPPMSDHYMFAREETYEFTPYATGPHAGEKRTRTRFVPTDIPAPPPMSDHYMFATPCDCADDAPDCCGYFVYDTPIPAPPPEDWQAIVEAVDEWLSADPLDRPQMDGAIADLAIAAVRNMRDAER